MRALHERHWRIDYKLIWNSKPLNSSIHFYIRVFFSFLSRSETWQVLEQSLIFTWTSFWNIWCQSLTLYSVIYCKTVLFVYQSCKNEAGRFFYLIFRLHWHPNIQKVLPWAQWVAINWLLPTSCPILIINMIFQETHFWCVRKIDNMRSPTTTYTVERNIITDQQYLQHRHVTAQTIQHNTPETVSRIIKKQIKCSLA